MVSTSSSKQMCIDQVRSIGLEVNLFLVLTHSQVSTSQPTHSRTRRRQKALRRWRSARATKSSACQTTSFGTLTRKKSLETSDDLRSPYHFRHHLLTIRFSHDICMPCHYQWHCTLDFSEVLGSRNDQYERLLQGLLMRASFVIIGQRILRAEGCRLLNVWEATRLKGHRRPRSPKREKMSRLARHGTGVRQCTVSDLHTIYTESIMHFKAQPPPDFRCPLRRPFRREGALDC